MHPNYPISLHFRCLLILAVMAAVATVGPCFAATITMSTASTTTKEGCLRQCGNVLIPYPFGIGLGGGCSLNPLYDVFCNLSSTPPTPFLLRWSVEAPYRVQFVYINEVNVFEILEISETQIRIRNPRVAVSCSNSSSRLIAHFMSYSFGNSFPPTRIISPFSFSSTTNKLVVVGCQETGGIFSSLAFDDRSCRSVCSSKKDVVGGQCDGLGCCQVAILPGSTSVQVSLFSNNSNAVSSFNPCGYAFLAEEGGYTFGGLSDLNDPNFPNRVMDTVPVAIDWVIVNVPCPELAHQSPFSYGACMDRLQNPSSYGTCAGAQLNQSTYACMGNTTCSDQFESAEGYKCFCRSGFQGNPYLPPGCSDIDECANPILNNCSMKCHNTVGSFNCPCPPGYTGDGRKNGSGCTKQSSQNFVLKLCLGISSGFLLLITGVSWFYCTVDRKRKLIKKKKKFFQQNGGWSLKEQLSMTNLGGSIEPARIFTEEELKASTNSFDKDCIIGNGGSGTVYKGILPDDGRVVAIKKSKQVDQNQIEQFINELVILGQINHRNVVKLLGCCLETEVPLLVYEFISKGTLYSHIHGSQNEGEQWNLKWSDCLRIASEAADALAYLHSAASPPIIHRDIKSMNILLDDGYTAKIADFGASRLIPMDQSQLHTLVQGTLGYLDPEYLHSSMLTEKSDVYSFGVVLAELLTRQKPFSYLKPEEDHNLASYFVRSIEEGTLFDIFYPQWLCEASTRELDLMASIAQRCLKLSGRDRPTMREVSVELQAIKKLKKQPQKHQTVHEETETTVLLHSFNITRGTQSSMLWDGERDLYPVPRGR